MTRLRVRLHKEDDRELNDGADYYDLESANLRSAFITELERGFARISELPDIGVEVGGGRRKLVLATFPYSIIYEIGSGDVLVLAVAHQRKRRFYWRGRQHDVRA